MGYVSHDPGFQYYPNLKERAERLDQWELWRPKAIGAIRPAISDRKSTQTLTYFRPDNSDLVRVYLFEEDVEAAWDEARQGGCDNRLWLQLAEKRESLHPEEPIPIYKAHIEALVQSGNNPSYEAASSYLKRIRVIATQTEFQEFVGALQTRHKAKRNFMKLLGSVAECV